MVPTAGLYSDASRSLEDDFPVFFFSGQTVAVSVAAEYDETQVVVVCGYTAQESEGFGVFFRRLQNLAVSGILVVIPQDARPETFCPEFLAYRVKVPCAVTRCYVFRGHHAACRTDLCQSPFCLAGAIAEPFFRFPCKIPCPGMRGVSVRINPEPVGIYPAPVPACPVT